MRVENFHVKNQFVVFDENGNCYFQSYQSIIAKNDVNGKIFLDKVFWNYSRTTSKYLNLFLGENRKQIESKIKEGIYQLVNLN